MSTLIALLLAIVKSPELFGILVSIFLSVSLIILAVFLCVTQGMTALVLLVLRMLPTTRAHRL